MKRFEKIKTTFLLINDQRFALIFLILFIFLINNLFSQTYISCPIQPFGEIEVDPQFILDGDGENVDTIEFWEAPETEKTLMFVTAKDNRLVEVWKYPFVDNEQPALKHSSFTGRVNGLYVDQETDLLYVSIAGNNPKVSVFTIPDFNFVMSFVKPDLQVDLGSEPNLTMLKLQSGEKRIYLSSKDSVYIHDAATGEFLDQFKPASQLETLFGDNYYQRIYIPDEFSKKGIYVYNPDGTPYLDKGSNNFGSDNIFQSDGEGIWLYTCPSNGFSDNGAGFIIVSDQRPEQTEFEVFDRQGWEHLGTFKIEGVNNTDGIRSFQKELPNYPLGLFVAIDNDNTTVGVGWDTIFKAMGITVNIESQKKLPQSIFLEKNYPNPFNPLTRIAYYLSAKSDVWLTIHDSKGQKIRNLVHETQNSGKHFVDFDANELTSGVYFYTLRTGTFQESRKMVLIR